MRRARESLVYEVSRLWAHGESIRSIARNLHCDRKTVRRILRDLEQRRAQGDDALARALKPKRAPRPSKLDFYVDFIRRTLDEFPDILATRLHEELIAQGFDGSYTIVREFLNQLRPKRTKKPCREVKTGPGKQSQSDWSPYKIESGVIHAFSNVLGYSRYQYARFCENEQQPTLFRQLRKSFDFWKGVPAEIVFDNPRPIVAHWENGEPILNLKMLDFASFYNFEIHLAPRANGAYKGKVERPFRYFDTSVFNARRFHSLKEANAFLRWWLDNRCNTRTHGTLRRRPVDLFQEEQASLRPLPRRPYDDRELAYRLIDPYGRIHFGGNLYSVGEKVGEWVYIRASEALVQIYDKSARLLTEHERLRTGEHGVSQHPEHTPKKGRRVSIERLLLRFEVWGDEALAFAKELRSRSHYGGVQLGNILDLQRSYTIEDLLAALRHATKYGAYDSGSVERILQAQATPRSLKDLLARRCFDAIQKNLSGAKIQQRSLDEYGQLLSPNTEKEVQHDGEEQEAEE